MSTLHNVGYVLIVEGSVLYSLWLDFRIWFIDGSIEFYSLVLKGIEDEDIAELKGWNYDLTDANLHYMET